MTAQPAEFWKHTLMRLASCRWWMAPSLADPDSISKLTQAIKNGDVLLFRPWWDDPQTADIEHIYSLVGNDHHS